MHEALTMTTTPVLTLTRALILIAALPALSSLRYRHPLAPSSQSCWQAPAAFVDPMLGMLRTRVSATGGQADQLRPMAGLLQDSADSVYVVADEQTCHRGAVALALSKSNPDTTSLPPVLVIKAGRARFVIDDGATKGGEYMVSYVADTSFVILGGLVH